MTGSALASPAISLGEADVPTALDHILLGSSDLDQGIAFVKEHTGVAPPSAASTLGAARATRSFRSATGIISKSSHLTPPSPARQIHMA
jgi:hypothetical protein